MKKIFTLISMAFMAMSVNAQEVWSAGVLDAEVLNTTSEVNTNPGLKKVETVYATAPDAADVLANPTAVQNPMNNFFFQAETANITLKGISTPNSDVQAGEAWQKNTDVNNALDTEECDPQFSNFVKPKAGNPAIESVEYFFLNSDGDQVGPRYAEVYWTEGCGQVPARGCYYELTAAADGTVKIGVYVNKGNHATYIADKATGIHIPAANIKVEFYYQNKTFTFQDGETTVSMVKGTMPDDFIIQHTNGYTQNRPVLGYMIFPVEAGKTYYLFNPKSQLGVYGFQFSGTSGVKNINTTTNIANAPRYNLAGQKVSKDFKGVVLQNGKKFVQK